MVNVGQQVIPQLLKEIFESYLSGISIFLTHDQQWQSALTKTQSKLH